MSSQSSIEAGSLRHRTEDSAGQEQLPDREPLSPEKLQRMLHELLVHKVELEMQNEELRRTQHELEITRSRFIDLYDRAPVGHLTLDGQGRILETNQTAARLLGVEKGTLAGQPLSRYILPKDRDIFCLHCQKLALSGAESEACEFRARKSNGEILWVQMDTAPVHNGADENALFRTIMSDISARKKTEEELRIGEARYLSIIEDQTELICRYLPDGRLSFVNAAYARYYGQSRSDLINTNFTPHIPQPDLSMTRECLAAISPDHPVAAFTHRIVNSKGEICWQRWTHRGIYSADGGLQEFQAVGFDITERKLAELVMQARLRINDYLFGHSLNELLTKILDEAEELTNSRIGFFHFLEADQTTLALQTWSSRTLTSICTAERKEHRYPLEEAGIWCDCVRERRSVIHNDYPSQPNRKGLPKGHTPLVREMLVPIFRNNLIVALLGVGNKPDAYTHQDLEMVQQLANLAWDIIEHKQAEIALRQARDELESKVAERTSALTLANEEMKRVSFELVWAEERERERIAGELHDRVGQSLLLAKMKLDALADELPPDALRATALDAAALVVNSIQDIRSLTFRMRPPILDTAGIETALQWLCSSIGSDYALQVTFSSDSHPKPLSAGARYLLYQAVRELLLNIVKHAGYAEAQLTLTTLDNNLLVLVADNGAGFSNPDAILKHVNNGGYGLYNVRQRIEQLGGSFAIESIPGQGTRVSLTVPLSGD